MEKNIIGLSYGTCGVYKLTLQQYSEVTYSNHYTTESYIAIEKMNVKQLGYFAQDITVINSDKADLHKISLDLPMLFCTVTCKNISIDRVKKIQYPFLGRINHLKWWLVYFCVSRRE